jgi:GDP-L-fucose synthase
MVGSAMMRALQGRGFTNLITASRRHLDLRDRPAVRDFFHRTSPQVIVLSAAKVGGINANRLRPAEFLYDNLAIQTNVIEEARQIGVDLLVILGSSCVYPRECPQPMREESLLTGPLEPTNEGYAVAKIAGLRMAQYYARQYGMRVVCPMPCNLYGTNDSFDLENSHVLSALVRRFCDAVAQGNSRVTVWGSGLPRREFLHVDDAAEGILLFMERWLSPEIINLGTGSDVTIRELAELIAEKTGFQGEIAWDTNMPDGMPRKLLDVTKAAALGFQPRISLSQGVVQTISEYRTRREQSKAPLQQE